MKKSENITLAENKKAKISEVRYLEKSNEENSEGIRLQVPENNSQSIPESELAKVEKWTNKITYLNYAGFVLMVLASIFFVFATVTEALNKLLYAIGIVSTLLSSFFLNEN